LPFLFEFNLSSEKSITPVPESQSGQAINIDKLYSRLRLTQKSDQFRLKKRLMSSKKITDIEKKQKNLSQISTFIEESINNKQTKILIQTPCRYHKMQMLLLRL